MAAMKKNCSKEVKDLLKQSMAEFFSPDWINPVRDKITRLRLVKSSVKEQHKHFRFVDRYSFPVPVRVGG